MKNFDKFWDHMSEKYGGLLAITLFCGFIGSWTAVLIFLIIITGTKILFVICPLGIAIPMYQYHLWKKEQKNEKEMD